MTSDENRLPVTVITGYLGSGKTTLINYILTANHGKRIAVIENEFGEIGIDDALVINAEEEIFEMNNGCICCTVRGDLIRILGNLMKRKDKFDYILVETTGLADPAPVAQTFLVDDEIRSQLKLDAIVTVADAKFLIQHLDDEKEVGIENEAVEQIAFADRVLLNKIDLVSDEERKEVIRRIRLINANAEIIPTTMSQVYLDQVLGVGAFDLNRVLEMEPEFLLDTEHQHDLSITSVGIDCEGKVSVQKINEWLGWLLGERGTDIFRMKGILNMWDDDRRFVFQGVHMLFDGTPGKPWGDGEERRNRMVFIGRNLDRQDLERRFKACIISSEE